MVAQSRSMVQSSGLSSLPRPATPPTPTRPNLFLITFRFGVSVVALAAMVGTLLSVLQPEELSLEITASQAIAPETPTPNLPPERPLPTLQQQIQQLIARQPN
ncbi:MAG: serine hydrolase, partial [Thermosynechococcus sp.]